MRYLWAAALACAAAPALADGEEVQIRGEVIDTWCYFSGVMGGPDAVRGTAHHTCAIWCSAGGIPVGLLGEDGTVYMILAIGGDDQSAGGQTQLELASHDITVSGRHFARDGLNYLVVDEVVEDHGITNINHVDYGAVPGFAIPNPEG
ncbi:hypothetical protein HKCCE4037_12340 [Rhodobacterales bacterium HKCCE4037]|nr:hypothetical protein [Rhodobacterales bacterium HKCCE4037]